MSVQAKSPIRSWVFVYVGLIASIIMAGEPAGADDLTQAQSAEPDAIPNLPYSHRDI